METECDDKWGLRSQQMRNKQENNTNLHNNL